MKFILIAAYYSNYKLDFNKILNILVFKFYLVQIFKYFM